MKAYELLYFVDPATDDAVKAGVLHRIQSTIEDDGGTIEEVDNWGSRKLAYEVDHLGEGDYTLVNFQADPAHIAELDRVLGIIDVVKRSMIVVRAE